MRSWHRLFLGLSLVACAAIAASVQWLDPEPAVYEAAVAGIYSSEVAIASSPSTCGVIGNELVDSPAGLAKAFLSANRPGAALGRIEGLSKHFAIANSMQLAAQEANSLHPRSAGVSHLPIVRLSRVGFSTDGSEALMCIWSAQGAALIYLEKAEGSWHLSKTESLITA